MLSLLINTDRAVGVGFLHRPFALRFPFSPKTAYRKQAHPRGVSGCGRPQEEAQVALTGPSTQPLSEAPTLNKGTQPPRGQKQLRQFTVPVLLFKLKLRHRRR